MDYIVIEGVKPYDGQYDFDLFDRELTTREWGWIKRLTGYLPLTLEDAFRGADPELFCCFATIAMQRAGKIAAADVADVFGRLAEAPFLSTIRLHTDGAAEDAIEDADPLESSNGTAATSGPDSPPSSAISDGTPRAIGTPDSATSESAPAR